MCNDLQTNQIDDTSLEKLKKLMLKFPESNVDFSRKSRSEWCEMIYDVLNWKKNRPGWIIKNARNRGGVFLFEDNGDPVFLVYSSHVRHLPAKVLTDPIVNLSPLYSFLGLGYDFSKPDHVNYYEKNVLHGKSDFRIPGGEWLTNAQLPGDGVGIFLPGISYFKNEHRNEYTPEEYRPHVSVLTHDVSKWILDRAKEKNWTKPITILVVNDDGRSLAVDLPYKRVIYPGDWILGYTLRDKKSFIF